MSIDEARRLSFDASAALYDAARPGYPDALADDLLATAGRRVLEIGAGTGKATVVFARRGASIVAIEPGPSLAVVLRRNVAGNACVPLANSKSIAQLAGTHPPGSAAATSTAAQSPSGFADDDLKALTGR